MYVYTVWVGLVTAMACFSVGRTVYMCNGEWRVYISASYLFLIELNRGVSFRNIH